MQSSDTGNVYEGEFTEINSIPTNDELKKYSYFKDKEAAIEDLRSALFNIRRKYNISADDMVNIIYSTCQNIDWDLVIKRESSLKANKPPTGDTALDVVLSLF